MFQRTTNPTYARVENGDDCPPSQCCFGGKKCPKLRLKMMARQHHLLLHVLMFLSIAFNVSFYYQFVYSNFISASDAGDFGLQIWNYPDQYQVSVLLQRTLTYNHDADDGESTTVPIAYPEFSDLANVPTPPDYGGLKFQHLPPGEKWRREITDDYNEYYPSNIEHKRLEIHAYNYHMATILRRSDEIDPNSECQPPAWSFDQYPTCNNFHDVDLLASIVGRREGLSHSSRSLAARYLGSGFFRCSWKLRRRDPLDPDSFDFVLKMLKEDKDIDRQNLRTIQIEASTMERLTASPRTMNIYGHCAGSIYVEPGTRINSEVFNRKKWMSMHEMNKTQSERRTISLNNMTVSEKLDVAIEMAESMAELHGYEGGAIALLDIYVDQWLRSDVDGRLKLNDFNNAAFLEWNEKKQEYCPLYASFSGRTHSPEEYYNSNVGWHEPRVTEQADIFDFANVLYNLLTGLEIHFNVDESKDSRAMMLDGKTPYIDHRFRGGGTEERRLVEIIDRMWKVDPSERPTIFEVVKMLRKARERTN